MFVPGGAVNEMPYRHPLPIVPPGVLTVIVPPGQLTLAMAPVLTNQPFAGAGAPLGSRHACTS